MEKNKLPDTPWHVGYAKKEENDPRRHKSRCINLSRGVCVFGKSGCYLQKCPGSSHCSYYAENEEQLIRAIEENSTVEEEADRRALRHRQIKMNEWQKIRKLGKEEINKKYFFNRNCPLCNEKMKNKNGIPLCEYCGFNPEGLDLINWRY